MGALIAKLWGRKSTKDLLDKITSQLKDIESFNRDTQAWQKKVIGTLIAYFSVLYICAILFAYYNYYYDPEWQDFQSRLKLFTPFLVAPLIIFFLKRILTWWYHRKLKKNESQKEKLKEEKNKILEDVMEKETYKVAKEILDTYGTLDQFPKPSKTKISANEKSAKTSGGLAQTVTSNSSLIQEPAGGSNLRQRRSGSFLPGSSSNVAHNPANSLPASPFRATSVSNINSGVTSDGKNNKQLASTNIKDGFSPQVTPGHHMQKMSQQTIQRRMPGPPLPRPVLPRERGYMDRVVEYLVGDGPSNRFALICKQCQSHNGMALKEEFEYIAYRCCYCFYWNPARKQKPIAPRLQAPPMNTQSSTDSTSSGDEDEAVSSKTSQNPTTKASNIQEEKPIIAEDLKKTDEKDNTCEEKALVNDSSTTSDNSEDTEKIPDELLKDNVEDPIDVNSVETSSAKVVESDGGEEMDIT